MLSKKRTLSICEADEFKTADPSQLTCKRSDNSVNRGGFVGDQHSAECIFIYWGVDQAGARR